VISTYKLSVGKPELKRELGRYKCTWAGNIKMGLEEIVCENLSWIQVVSYFFRGLKFEFRFVGLLI
jgi:hypothetical protein